MTRPEVGVVRLDVLSRREKLILAGIVLLALLLRLDGLRFGLPDPGHPDEETLLEASFYLLLFRTLRPTRFEWPSLSLYLGYLLLAGLYAVGRVTGTFSSFDSLVTAWKTDPTPFFLVVRSLSVVAGTATLWPVWLLAHRLYGRRAALFATAAMATLPLAVLHSHYAVPDTQLTFWVASALAAAAAVLDDGAPRLYLTAGFLVGLAVSTKYNAFLAGLPVLVAHLLRERFASARELLARTLDRRLIGAGVAALAAFFLTSPYAALDFGRFVHDVRWQSDHMATGHAGIAVSPWEHFWLFHFRHSIVPGLTLPGTLAVLAALVLLAVRRRPGDWLLLGWIVPFYLMMEDARGKPPPDYARAILPLTPAFAVALGTAADSLWSRAERAPAEVRTRVRRGAMTATALFGAWWTLDAHMLGATLRPDTRDVARDWITSHRASLGTVYANDQRNYTPPIAGGEPYEERVSWIADHPGTYVISSFRTQRYEDDHDLPEPREFYRELRRRSDLVAEFRPRWRSLCHSNPTISILHVR